MVEQRPQHNWVDVILDEIDKALAENDTFWMQFQTTDKFDNSAPMMILIL